MLAPTVTAAHAPLTHTSRPPVSACLQPEGGVAPELLEMMKEGGYFFKHDFGRAKRGRKHLKLSTDGLKITWKSVGMNEVVPEGSGTDRSSPSARSILRSASFSRTTSSEFFPHTHLTNPFLRKVELGAHATCLAVPAHCQRRARLAAAHGLIGRSSRCSQLFSKG